MRDELAILGYGETWDEILGEQTRGGGAGMRSAEDILGAAFNAAGNPAYAGALATRAGRAAPAVKSQLASKVRDWSIGFGPQYIGVGKTVTITVNPQCLFRAEKLIAADNSAVGIGPANGAGTAVTGATVGQKNQMPANSSLMTWSFGPGTLGNGIKWDTCQPGLSLGISVTDQSVTAGGSTWAGTLSGKAII